jgi:glycosyltransferase involved in cell wall biosynthesis
LPKEKADKCKFLLHTELVHEAGTDLSVVKELLFDDKYPNAIVFDTKRWSTNQLNTLYNISDCQILLTCNEGWGLTLTEAMLAGNPIIANTTGGMQDQMRFEDEKGEWFTPSPKIPSNNTGKFNTWEPREAFEVIDSDEDIRKIQTHNLVY